MSRRSCRREGLTPAAEAGANSLALALSRNRFRVEDGVRDARDLNHFGDVMNAHDMRASKNASGYSCRGAPSAFGDRRPAEHAADEGLARGADENRKAEAA